MNKSNELNILLIAIASFVTIPIVIFFILIPICAVEALFQGNSYFFELPSFAFIETAILIAMSSFWLFLSKNQN